MHNVNTLFPQFVQNHKNNCSGIVNILKHKIKKKHIDKTKAL